MNKLLHNLSKVPSSAVNLGSHSSGRLNPQGPTVQRFGRLSTPHPPPPPPTKASAYQTGGKQDQRGSDIIPESQTHLDFREERRRRVLRGQERESGRHGETGAERQRERGPLDNFKYEGKVSQMSHKMSQDYQNSS